MAAGVDATLDVLFDLIASSVGSDDAITFNGPARHGERAGTERPGQRGARRARRPTAGAVDWAARRSATFYCLPWDGRISPGLVAGRMIR